MKALFVFIAISISYLTIGVSYAEIDQTKRDGHVYENGYHKYSGELMSYSFKVPKNLLPFREESLDYFDKKANNDSLLTNSKNLQTNLAVYFDMLTVMANEITKQNKPFLTIYLHHSIDDDSISIERRLIMFQNDVLMAKKILQITKKNNFIIIGKPSIDYNRGIASITRIINIDENQFENMVFFFFNRGSVILNFVTVFKNIAPDMKPINSVIDSFRWGWGKR